jgi:hypothetical protein
MSGKHSQSSCSCVNFCNTLCVYRHVAGLVTAWWGLGRRAGKQYVRKNLDVCMTVPKIPLIILGTLFCNLAVAGQDTAGTIGLVLTEWRHALYETPGGTEECPDGFSPSDTLQHRAMPNSQEHLEAYSYYTNRGPNGEAVTHFPWLVEDLLPSPELQTTVGFGLNLDGTTNGHATTNSCAHEKFINPDGEPVDNQLARVVGCTETWRRGGFADEFIRQEIVSYAHNRILIEIKGVDSELNDPEVEVYIYKGKDGLSQGAGGSFPPFQNQRVDERFPRYMHQTRGKIVEGILITEPIAEAWLPIFWVQTPAERLIRDMGLRLQLTETGAEGILGGYEDLKIWWNAHSKSGVGGGGASVGPFSNAWLYRAAHRYADGYPDPESGQCTAISAAYRVNAARALIAHPSREVSVNNQMKVSR